MLSCANKELLLMVFNQTVLLLYLVSIGAPFFAPLLFCLHMNDIDSDIESEIRLSADDCVCYRECRGNGEP